MTLAEIKKKKDAFEADGTQCMGVRFTREQAAELRRELHFLYGFDPGPGLTTFYGLEVLSVDAERFELVA